MLKRFSDSVAFAILFSVPWLPVHAESSVAAQKTKQQSAIETLASIKLGEKTTLIGRVTHREIHLPATIIIRDQLGLRRQGQTDDQGNYHLDISGLSSPLRLLAIESGGTNCQLDNVPRAICLNALAPSLQSGHENIVNINPLTDRIVSDVAVAAGYIGPQQLTDDSASPTLDNAALKKAYAAFHAGFNSALKQTGITSPARFDPLTYPAAQQDAVTKIINVINHNRNYDNNTGYSGHTVLTDSVFRPIVGLYGQGAYEPLDYHFARQHLDAIQKAQTRIFLVGDSTAAAYEKARLPRMGWGQVFEQQFRTDSGVKVVNGARAGRGSRDYFYEGWFRQMQPLMKAGDFLFIQMGNNDQNCNSARPERGAADVANLCTYPNDATGKTQSPPGKSDMSFQTSLERYVNFARQHQLTPVLLTPTTRVRTADGKIGTPVVHNHFTTQNAEGGYAFIGDYSQTIKNTAAANKVILLDIEPATIALANQGNSNHWKQYWLAVDPARYPFYRNQTGSLTKPDPVHFQQRGAIAVSAIVADAIRKTPELKTLADKLVVKSKK
ncbi:rhamnogalacturonan acetylesterase [Brenneria goodwinii]|uniref:Rhamnogalacturonan acetylesterase n=1 Tax=Brenneria goodwinii TaxID=1109412 RepID=A0A0G4JWT3_9GAMM|nr:pectin acetylesterase PaeY [Brenneria goodwinii]MCG8156703.1 rhamnogalacturonan acetylesterase [Brenneria goodwinii]MCG8160183.1 rhamnogalacturonan acetylesterase [Brenneria goodwinii]MCG8164706.1 rhamnogalacturonan acetylesterase [Brenneria goodwinii]MCG8171536.1 rhamnogalacturonan acetylesterase [Brenneria goodwinii]MCG8174116.1 rhamnogalacturonan acetylesterase [Brenneria goodwinii]